MDFQCNLSMSLERICGDERSKWNIRRHAICRLKDCDWWKQWNASAFLTASLWSRFTSSKTCTVKCALPDELLNLTISANNRFLLLASLDVCAVYFSRLFKGSVPDACLRASR